MGQRAGDPEGEPRKDEEVGGIRLETSSRFVGSKKAHHQRPHFIGICMKNRGVRFHRIRDFEQYYFNSIPPTSQRRLRRRLRRVLDQVQVARLPQIFDGVLPGGDGAQKSRVFEYSSQKNRT